MTPRPDLPAAHAEVEDPPIVHHYIFVLMVEALALCGLAWLAAHYR